MWPKAVIVGIWLQDRFVGSARASVNTLEDYNLGYALLGYSIFDSFDGE